MRDSTGSAVRSGTDRVSHVSRRYRFICLTGILYWPWGHPVCSLKTGHWIIRLDELASKVLCAIVNCVCGWKSPLYTLRAESWIETNQQGYSTGWGISSPDRNNGLTNQHWTYNSLFDLSWTCIRKIVVTITSQGFFLCFFFRYLISLSFYIKKILAISLFYSF